MYVVGVAAQSFCKVQVLLVNGLFGNVENWAVVKVRAPTHVAHTRHCLCGALL